MARRPEINYALSDDLSIAYQMWGDGPHNIVLVPGMISHLEAQMDHPGYVRLVEQLGEIGRLVVFDKRGNGMSDRMNGAPTLDERMMDIDTVMTEVGMSSATLIGASEGASLACVFAGTFPEQVDTLVLCGGYARGRLARGFIDEAGLQHALVQFRKNWGKVNHEHPLSGFGPGPGDPQGQERRARFERLSATPTTVAALFEIAARIDIRDMLPNIPHPTLVLHRETETPNGLDCAEEFTGLMPNARRRALPGSEHLIWEGDVDSYIAAITEFITGGETRARPTGRFLATVMFSDLAASTSAQARMGDEAWRAQMDRHDKTCDDLVERHGGRRIKFTGDGVLATFETPSRALACACALRQALSDDGLAVRFGTHTGEIEKRGDDIGGLGVVVAARIVEQAEAGQILASDLTRQLMLGSPYSFTERGERVLKGVPETWRLFEVDA